MPSTTVFDEKQELEEYRRNAKWARHSLNGIVDSIVEEAMERAKSSYNEQCSSATTASFCLGKERAEELSAIRNHLLMSRSDFFKHFEYSVRFRLIDKGHTKARISFGRHKHRLGRRLSMKFTQLYIGA